MEKSFLEKNQYFSLFLARKPAGLWLVAPVCGTVTLLYFWFASEQSSYAFHRLLSLSFSLLVSWRHPNLWWGLQSTQQRQITWLQHQPLPALSQQRRGIYNHQQLSPPPAHQNQKQSKVMFFLCVCLHWGCNIKTKTQLVSFPFLHALHCLLHFLIFPDYIFI